MPDIQSELTKVIQNWDNEEPAHFFKPTTNVSRVTFEFVAKNPGLTPTQIMSRLKDRGYKPSSVTSLVGQMVRVGMLRRDEKTGGVFSVAPSYVPIKVSKLKAVRKSEAKAPAKPKAVEVDTPEPKPVRLVRMQTADEVLANMSVSEAYRLYSKLSTMFGGK